MSIEIIQINLFLNIYFKIINTLTKFVVLLAKRDIIVELCSYFSKIIN